MKKTVQKSPLKNVEASSEKSDFLTDINDAQESLLGPDYPYWKNIKNPEQLGMSDKGSLEVMERCSWVNQLCRVTCHW